MLKRCRCEHHVCRMIKLERLQLISIELTSSNLVVIFTVCPGIAGSADKRLNLLELGIFSVQNVRWNGNPTWELHTSSMYRPRLPDFHIRIPLGHITIPATTEYSIRFAPRSEHSPSCLLATLRILTISFLVGFISHSSLLRPAALLIILSCVYLIVSNSHLYMRSHWSGMLGGMSCTYLFQYIDLCLLSRGALLEMDPPNVHPTQSSLPTAK